METETEDTRCRWIVEYPTDRQEQITAAYRLAVVVVQTDEWMNDWQVREAQRVACSEYMEMRDQYRRLMAEREQETSDYKS
jgi:hypothetical protein